ncbi:MAG: hypothetical protein AXA67_01260 [Methylothermaceae bacteria B42]|nr:MAG: hypothetical protein AXA67_01260 [Methylothermaceae bacteria B42]HHJ40507.1 DUF3147 family protein [Methylothermaceae bacterium]
MSYYLAKLVISAILIVIISEIAKRHALIGAVLASVPLVSVIAMIWIYWETHDTQRIIAFSHEIMKLMLPSLVLFLLLPELLERKAGFYLSLGLSIAATAAAYGLTIFLLRKTFS